VASVLDLAAIGELGNATRHLCAGEPAHLTQILVQHAFIGARCVSVIEFPQRVSHPAIGGVAICQRKRDSLVARNKGAYLRQCLQSLDM
jgi:hypothetical protein